MRAQLGLLAFCLILPGIIEAQPFDPNRQNEIFWRLCGGHAIVWDLRSETRLPHADNIEMSGSNVSAIITYRVEKDRTVKITRDVIFPQLRVFLRSTERNWRRYRAYLRDEYSDQFLPELIVDQRRYEPGALDSVRIAGILQFFHGERQGLKLVRSLLPSMSERLFVEKWQIINLTDSIRTIQVGHTEFNQTRMGVKGRYDRRIFCDAPALLTVPPGGQVSFGVYMAARMNQEPWPAQTVSQVEAERSRFLEIMRTHFVLETPDSLLNTLFYFSKIRAAWRPSVDTIGWWPVGLRSMIDSRRWAAA